MLIGALIAVSLLFFVATYFAIKFGITIIKIQDAIEESLDIIDEKYDSISEICERPLFYDSPEVRRVLQDIKSTRDALYVVALSLTNDFSNEDDDDEG